MGDTRVRVGKRDEDTFVMNTHIFIVIPRIYVGFVLDKLAPGQVFFSHYFCLPVSESFDHCHVHYMHLPSAVQSLIN